MRVLVGCEYSGTVRDAFNAIPGVEAWSCDIIGTERDAPHHFIGNIFSLLDGTFVDAKYDLIILHPPCTAMAVCGNRHYAGTQEREKAIKWTMDLWELAKTKAKSVALENPASVIFPHLRKAGAEVQYIQPYQFGHMEQKKTGLALHNLPLLKPTNDVYDEMMELPKKERERVFYMSPSEDRGKERARFYTGIAKAMADQWGSIWNKETN